MTPPADPRPQPRPRRVAAAAGTVAGALLVAAFFIPFLSLDAGEAKRVADHLTDEVAKRSVDMELGRDFARVFQSVADQGYVRLADVVHYARTAGRERGNVIYGGERSGPQRDRGAPAFERLLWLLLIAAAGPPLGGVLLVGYFVYHGWRRARSPMLILAFVVGVLGLVFPAGLQYARYELEPHMQPALGYWLGLVGAAVLVLVALFGVTLRNWWRVYLGSSITLASLALVGWAYLEGAFGS